MFFYKSKGAFAPYYFIIPTNIQLLKQLVPFY